MTGKETANYLDFFDRGYLVVTETGKPHCFLFCTRQTAEEYAKKLGFTIAEYSLPVYFTEDYFL